MTPVAPTADPLTSSPPLVGVVPDAPHRFDRLYGSSFIVASEHPSTLLVTAAHVAGVAAAQGPSSVAAAVMSGDTTEVPLVPIRRWHVRADLDLAVGFIEHDGLRGFNLHNGRPSVNADIVTIEHSGSIHSVPDQPGFSMITPLLRKGYVVQARRGLHPGLPDVMMLELSYPALKGASGAPVFEEGSLRIIGVVVANVEREMMPAQVLRAYREDGTPLEEIHYFLPNALAVGWEHVAEVVAEAEALLDK